MSEIKTIEDRFVALKEKYGDEVEIEYATELERHEDGWLCKAFLIINGKCVATGHKFKDHSYGEDAPTTAETQAVSRAIGFHLGDKHIHTIEELEEVAQRKVKELRQCYKETKDINELKQRADAERDGHVKRRMQQYISGILAEKSSKAARKTA